MAIVANRGARIPARTLCPLGHWVIQTLRNAALAAGCLAGVATALAVFPAREVATRTLAACATGRHTDVTAACAARSTLELLALPAPALDGIRSASCALGHWVLVPSLPLVAALAARSGTGIATALAALLTRKRVTVAVAAAEIALRLARVATALAVATREEMAAAVEACGHAEASKPLAQIEGLRGLESQEGSLFAFHLIQALPVHAGMCLRCSHRHQKRSCCNRLQGHGGKKCV